MCTHKLNAEQVLLLMSGHKSEKPKRVRPSDNHQIIFSQGILIVFFFFVCCSSRCLGDKVGFQEVTESLYNYSRPEWRVCLLPSPWDNMRHFCEQNTAGKEDKLQKNNNRAGRWKKSYFAWKVSHISRRQGRA